MKKITIEISDNQAKKMKEYLEKCFTTSISEETIEELSLVLTNSVFGSTLDMKMYGELELGDVEWKIED